MSGRRIGTLVLLYDLGEIAERIELYGATVGVRPAASSLIAFLLSSRLRAVIATPIAQLVRATTSVSETGDYSIRARKFSTTNSACWWIDSTRCWPASSPATTISRKRSRDREEALRDAEKARERFRFMAESMPQKIFTAKPDGETDYFNRQWLEFTGLPFEQIKNWGWTQFVHPDDLEENCRSWRHSI